jgi:hypothetical protein
MGYISAHIQNGTIHTYSRDLLNFIQTSIGHLAESALSHNATCFDLVYSVDILSAQRHVFFPSQYIATGVSTQAGLPPARTHDISSA